MSKYTVSIPGEILDEKIALGLTFMEIVALAAAPLVMVLPVLLPIPLVPDIPISIILALIVVGVLFVLGIVIAAPAGQSPLVWFPSYMNRRVNPNTYQLKPRDNTEFGSPSVTYRDVVYTAPLVEEENSKKELTAADVAEMIQQIEYAEKIELPTMVSEDEVIENLQNSDGKTERRMNNSSELVDSQSRTVESGGD